MPEPSTEILDFGDALDQIFRTVNLVRDRALSEGYSQTTAEMMASSFFDKLMRDGK